MELFHFDRARALAAITDPDGALWPVNAYSDADELDALAAAAIDTGIVARAHPRVRLYVYPLSLSEPEPLLAVDPGCGPTLLGCSLKLAEREGEDPVSFTLRLLDDLVATANGLATSAANSQQVPLGPEPTALATEAGEGSGRYALVVVLDAAGPEQAWESVHSLLGGLEGGEEPECVYVGAPWQGIPAEAEDLHTEQLVLGMSVPDGEGGFVATAIALRPCD